MGRPVPGLRPHDAAERDWKRQCYATDQADPIGVKLLEELGDLRESVRRKVICDNAAAPYGFPLA